MKVAVSSFVSVGMLIDLLMTDTGYFVLFHPQRDLYWTPVLPDLFLDIDPSLGLNTFSLTLSYIYRFTIGLIESISSLATNLAFLVLV